MVTAPQDWQRAFLDQQRLPADYLGTALKWFTPVGQLLAEHQVGAGRPRLVAVNGSQGSGKSTLCAYLCDYLSSEHGLRALSLSLDDFYLTHGERQQLAAEVHPLLQTRGVPGTHDMDLLLATLASLLAGRHTAVPRFDKAVDDRVAESAWDSVTAPLDIIFLEGWCLGVGPQPDAALLAPVNELERGEDPDGAWRRYVNQVLHERFPAVYALVHEWVMLRAPSFDCVYRWRLEQEAKLAATRSGSGIMSSQQVARFIQHYQRLTQHCLASLPRRVNHLFRLDKQRHILSYMAAPGVRP